MLAQNKQVTHQQLIWLGYHNTVEWHSGWSVNSEIEERRYFNPDKQHQFLVRSQLKYTLGASWSVAAGLAYFLQSPQNPKATETLVVPELRPHLQLDYRQQIHKLTITHRYRAEKRFFRNVVNEELTKGYNSNYRFRYRIGLELPVANIKQQPLKLKINDEIMFNAGKRIANNSFDQNRIYGGLNYTLNQQVTVEAGYLKWFQQRASGFEYYDRDIVRLVVTHNISVKSKKNEDN
ncbi:hypothetical protein ABID22_000043 [Pontibacter aydingkolensis]|uniref:DUF2490 domain-containing protein n=1 Tax=Pontibacter aydingkolensis TaxID=1911536 RepID=A0ABS7CR74_9BACT|nr:DUF2490 domain-containing protein [Pontibacter aydingkolensis]MBW7466283.1 DUF2490 domain-containing protein [Pontibacter aydingkolensis]